MARLRVCFEDMTLYDNEEAGNNHVALYAAVTDAAGTRLAAFQWNALDTKIDDPGTFILGVDPNASSVADFELTGTARITVNGYGDDDLNWPNAGSRENDLGSASILIDTAAPATLGHRVIGPTTTDGGHNGFSVKVRADIIAPLVPGELRLTFNRLQVINDEESGDCQLAAYVRAKAPAQGGVAAIDTELLRWNNGAVKVDDGYTYPLTNGAVTTTLRLPVGGPTQIWVEGWTHDDVDWPYATEYENRLGSAVIVLDPADPDTLGQRLLGPTITDNGRPGYEIDLLAELLPGGSTPALKITGVEVTQAIQHFGSTGGPDNSLPLVAGKDTLVRVYVDSGTDPAGENRGLVRHVTGTLTITGVGSETLTISEFTARPLTGVDREMLDHTANFRIPASLCHGDVTITVQVAVPGSTSSPEQLTVAFGSVQPRNILVVRIGTPTVAPPTDTEYIDLVNQLPRLYPIPTSPSQAIVYSWPSNPVWITTRDLDKRTPSGDEDLSEMIGLLEDLEDIQEDFEDWIKLYGLVPLAVPMNRRGIATENQAYGYPLLDTTAHELGHLYGLRHAPCPAPGSRNSPANIDGDFVPADGRLGDVGVDLDTASVTLMPATCGDLMSGCHPRWIGPYDWSKLFRRFQER